MEEKDIYFVLVQIDEAHTPLWPTGVIELGIPQKDFKDRCARAAAFAEKEVAGNDRFVVAVDEWSNTFANRFRAWPDKFYLINADGVVIKKSSYGSKKDAVIDEDCLDVLYSL